MTLPYVYVEPIIEVGSCSLELDPILSYGGPGECNYDKDEKTCDSDKTIKDTMKDQGWPCMLARGACLTAPGYVLYGRSSPGVAWQTEDGHRDAP